MHDAGYRVGAGISPGLHVVVRHQQRQLRESNLAAYPDIAAIVLAADPDRESNSCSDRGAHSRSGRMRDRLDVRRQRSGYLLLQAAIAGMLYLQ